MSSLYLTGGGKSVGSLIVFNTVSSKNSFLNTLNIPLPYSEKSALCLFNAIEVAPDTNTPSGSLDRNITLSGSLSLIFLSLSCECDELCEFDVDDDEDEEDDEDDEDDDDGGGGGDDTVTVVEEFIGGGL